MYVTVRACKINGWQLGMKRNQVTAQDVARHAGVSRVSVSRTFTPGASVSAKTRELVLKSAAELGYQVNHLARSLHSANSGIVALIASEVETPHRAEMLSVMTEVFQSAGKVTLLINTNGSDASVKDALMQAIRFRTETAVVLSGTPDQSIAEACQSNGIKLVLINRADEIDNALHILPDNDSVGEIALNALLNAGCETLALANSDTQTASIVARERSFLKAAEARGIAVRRCTSGLTTYESGLEIGTDLFSRGTRPDGVFCTTDLIACGVMDVARQRFGMQVPQDLSVIGFDDIAQAGWEAYQLTTFRQPIEKISQACLDWSLENGEEGGKITVPVRLVLRDSVRRPVT